MSKKTPAGGGGSIYQSAQAIALFLIFAFLLWINMLSGLFLARYYDPELKYKEKVVFESRLYGTCVGTVVDRSSRMMGSDYLILCRCSTDASQTWQIWVSGTDIRRIGDIK